MFNPYVIILILFTLGGVAMAIWGLQVLQRSKKVKAWPKVSGQIISSELPSSQFEAFSPAITFTYQVSQATYETQQDFQGASLSQEYCNNYVAKYPVGAAIEVFYDPNNPAKATLEPALEKGDWMIFAGGVLVTILGILMLTVDF